MEEEEEEAAKKAKKKCFHSFHIHLSAVCIIIEINKPSSNLFSFIRTVYILYLLINNETEESANVNIK